MRFAGKTVVITGAASGIGKATCLLFASEGATVIAGDIDEKGGEDLAATSNGKIFFKRTDVCNTADIKALMDFAAEKTGGIDVVFNNAGAGGDKAPIEEIEPEGWDRTMDLLLRSVAMGVRYAVPHMIGREGAAIVNTASVAGLGAGYSPTAYAVAKCGVIHLTKVGATDLAKHNIRMNAICPGFIQTNIFASSMEVPVEKRDEANKIIWEIANHTQPVKRGGRPEDIANMVAFLASKEAGFITGTHFVVDGGITTGQPHSWNPEAPGLFDALQAYVDAPQG
ncbi:SDR family oxidoreductase [Chakrabartia godavariana]|nr:SDR family oxidoreductase [Chakrabartia godavariana]